MCGNTHTQQSAQLQEDDFVTTRTCSSPHPDYTCGVFEQLRETNRMIMQLRRILPAVTAGGAEVQQLEVAGAYHGNIEQHNLADTSTAATAAAGTTAGATSATDTDTANQAAIDGVKLCEDDSLNVAAVTGTTFVFTSAINSIRTELCLHYADKALAHPIDRKGVKLVNAAYVPDSKLS
jgi:hypothetical protein